MLNFDWLARLSLWHAKLAIIFLFILLGMFVFSLKDSYVTAGISKPRFWHNLKYWAYGILIIMVLIYLYF